MRILALLCFTLLLPACSTIERADEQKLPKRARPTFDGEVPNMLRGTIKQHVALLGYTKEYRDEYQPIIAAGYGLVVNLNGTGSQDVPPQVRAHMIADLAKRGVGETTRGWGALTPEALLDSTDTAVVIVEGIIPQVATGRKLAPSGVRKDHPALKGTLFDVQVFVEPSSGTSSLEGGTLLPTILRVGDLRTGRTQTNSIAVAQGPIFINPFADPEAVGSDSVHRTSGRILEGGEVTKTISMQLVLFSPSHNRARAIQTAINRRFPEEPGQGVLTARAVNDEIIDITVPPSWSDHVDNFMNMMLHINIRSKNPEQHALTVKRLLLSDPSPRNADAAAWRWQAIGERSLPVIRELYDYHEDLPRLAALRTGGNLGDPVVTEHLIDAAVDGIGFSGRLEAIDLLQDMPTDPRIELALRPLLNDETLEIRLRTAETLIDRGDSTIKGGVVDKKFELFMAESNFPLIYCTQAGLPRIILLGELKIQEPIMFDTWSHRLLIKNAEEHGQLNVRYRSQDRRGTVVEEASTSIPSFICFLAHKPIPEAPASGLNLSYSRTVGLLHTLWKEEYLVGNTDERVDFKAQQDRLLAAINQLTAGTEIEPRKNFDETDLKSETGRFLEFEMPESAEEDAKLP
ncbi:MAG: flagellar basal body P-ring protein FlgI [Phycisphaerales bacterium]|nr:flagellar basal body P-ring protein FlgI [Phycisphaerales bacterium]